ncbi:hypothetical protein GCM10010106_24320 [Thermopolyspora flexuosa]|uniref:Uncharacterized protein n=1 Tax=Thermopolyspora flexuosa TaxID=103836 RepID=A0A543IVE8_9ACTN|nr:hypothetical protein [Thermopolyspora flexuosa]TQM74546.1 hypothetical protein FHX40_1224 [Thermopolyspora flexuosa]GGM77010.1 hypothetical protein GCM10010106_24320 [Thermopolyspora flexuosa]
MTSGSGLGEPDFARTARQLAEVLDEFSGLFEQALARYRPGKDALSRRIKVDKSYVSSWLRGHRQLLDPKGRRLVTSEDVERILEATRLAEQDAPLARRLRTCGTRIDTLVADLMAARPARWRSEAGRVLRADQERAERDRTPVVQEDLRGAPAASGQADASPQAPDTPPGQSQTGRISAQPAPADAGQDPAPAVPKPAGQTSTSPIRADAGPRATASDASDVKAPTREASAPAVPEAPSQASEHPADAERRATSQPVPGDRIPTKPMPGHAGQATVPSAPEHPARPPAQADAGSHAVTRPVPAPAGQAPAHPGEPRTSPGVGEPGPQDTAALGDRAPGVGEPDRAVPDTPQIHVLSPTAATGAADARPARGHRRRFLVATLLVAAVLVAALQIARSTAAREAGETGADTVSVGRLCREWAPQPVPVEIRPCIAAADGQVELWAELRAVDPADAPGEVTVWVWLMNLDRELIESRRFHLTRDQSTLNSCTLTVEDDAIVRCGPFRVTPRKPGEYATAVDTRREKDVLPPAWNHHTFSGTQSPSITWQ